MRNCAYKNDFICDNNKKETELFANTSIIAIELIYYEHLDEQHDLNCIFCARHKLKIFPKLKKKLSNCDLRPTPHPSFSTGGPPSDSAIHFSSQMTYGFSKNL